MHTLLWALICWGGLGFLIAMCRFLDQFELFYKCSWGQIGLLSFIYGPSWLIIGLIWVLWSIFKITLNKLEEFWNLLSEIGPR